MRAGVITFPGSNCDRDIAVALAAAEAELRAICEQLLANPVIETSTMTLED